MERIEPTRRIALRVWWAVVWRFVLCIVVIALMQSLLVGALIAMFEMSQEAAEMLTRAASLLFGFPLTLLASWEALYRIFDKRLGEFEVILLRHD